jgi:tetratricopeptide (TPR) repeat protein
MRTLLRILLIAFLPLTVTACVWDAQSLWREKMRSHDLAHTIFHNEPEAENTNALRATIKSLEANRQENDAMWWNNLAGAHIRLGEPAAAVKLLEPVVGKFPNDYGIHANLGTAYHLLGRYQEAEREIARDLEINPDAHFGLEKYHLALLQYLVRDPKYQARHVYVDEFTAGFLVTPGGPYYPSDGDEMMSKGRAEDYSNNVAAAEADYESLKKTNRDDYKIAKMLAVVAATDPPPPYRTNWNLMRDTNFEAGVIYMAQMNPKEPACQTMLGLAAWKKHDYHLAITAFEKAIALGSPQSNLLKDSVGGLKAFISRSAHNDPTLFLIVVCSAPLVILYYIYSKIRDWRKSKAQCSELKS